MKSLFRCPVCGGPLDREERVYRCADRHSYDIAKEATPICCPPIKSTRPRRGMTGIWPPHGGISSPRGIMTCFSIRSVVRFCLFPANRR